MNLRDRVLNYLPDNEKGMQQLITGFLNDVMSKEGVRSLTRLLNRHIKMFYDRAEKNTWTVIDSCGSTGIMKPTYYAREYYLEV
ncbi:MAG TPA: hypothetical protein VEF33_08185 [Syntrophales bacterium]|nr:hypothetical protein [Syntrophales bacterium]